MPTSRPLYLRIALYGYVSPFVRYRSLCLRIALGAYVLLPVPRYRSPRLRIAPYS